MYKEGNIINGHKILTNYGNNNFLIECGNCKNIHTKYKYNLLKTKKCINCRKRNNVNKRNIRLLCNILGLNEGVVRSRIQRGLSEKEALYFKGPIPKESFRDYDLIYIAKDNQENYEFNKEIEKKAYLKYKTRINNI